MKRDWDFIRDLLTDIEAGTDLKKKYVGTAEQEKFLYHARLLAESGYIERIEAKQNFSGEWTYSSSKPYLSEAGHDLLETIRSQTVWEKIKQGAKDKGIELTTESVKALGAWALKAMLG